MTRRRRHRSRTRRTSLRGFDRRWSLIAIMGVVLGCVAAVTVSRIFSVSCPAETACVTLSELRTGAQLPQAHRIFDRDGELIAEVGGPLRRVVSSERMPDLLSESYVLVEDRRFRAHEGVDYRGVLRAAVRNLGEGGISEGASTIPMQLVRTLWAESLRDVGPWRRKVIEARTAPRLIEDLGHDAVLTLYLNAIYLGNGMYGVERAAQHYFGAGVEDLAPGQIATLVGMTRSPEYYEPRRHPDRAQGVRDLVLGMMAEGGLITQEMADQATSEPLVLAELDDSASTRSRTHLTAAVRRELRDVVPALIGTPGLVLHTTIDGDIQRSGQEALERQMADIEAGRFGSFEVDSLTPLEAAAVAVDPETGAVRAWIGGRDFGRSEFDRVSQARRQVGSLAKPFLVAVALERGYGIVDMVSADTVPVPTSEGGWLPADHVLETSLPLREALVRSSNRAAAHLGVDLGLESLPLIGAKAGLSTDIPALPASSIGAFDASLLEMTSAYTSFGNGGSRSEPYLLERVEVSDGSLVWERTRPPEPTRVMAERTSFVVLDALRAVVDRGTGSSVRGYGYRRPAAGKTGTTNDGRDAWFVGLTPDLVAGVWIGFDTPREIVEGRGGGALAAPAWSLWMRDLIGEIPQRRAWVPPVGVERVRYDPETGQVLAPHCRDRSGRMYRDAWVAVGRYDRSSCPDTGVGGWLKRLWNAVTPSDPGGSRPPGGGP